MSSTLIGVGIDTARYGHHVSFLGVDKRKALTGFHFKESTDGYALLIRALDKLAAKFPDAQFSIRLDAAGQYAANLIRFLETLPHKASISVGQPKQNKDYKSVHFPKQKSDPVDSLACARFAVVEQPLPTPSVPLAFSQLREVLSALQSQTKRTTRLINQLHNRLSRTFPELAVLCPGSFSWICSHSVDEVPYGTEGCRHKRFLIIENRVSLRGKSISDPCGG